MIRTKKPSVDWFSGCETPEDRQKRLEQIQGASSTLQILRELLEHRRSQIDKGKKVSYENPAWQYQLAHENGQKEEIDLLLKLIDPLTE